MYKSKDKLLTYIKYPIKKRNKVLALFLFVYPIRAQDNKMSAINSILRMIATG